MAARAEDLINALGVLAELVDLTPDPRAHAEDGRRYATAGRVRVELTGLTHATLKLLRARHGDPATLTEASGGAVTEWLALELCAGRLMLVVSATRPETVAELAQRHRDEARQLERNTYNDAGEAGKENS